MDSPEEMTKRIPNTEDTENSQRTLGELLNSLCPPCLSVSSVFYKITDFVQSI